MFCFTTEFEITIFKKIKAPNHYDGSYINIMLFKKGYVFSLFLR
jgi:hypothetical protein